MKQTVMRDKAPESESSVATDLQVVTAESLRPSSPAVADAAIQHHRLSVAAAKPADVAIIGAGPYGLSIAAHLRAVGIRFRIFGRAMESWRVRMPEGMLLKSEGFASNLCDPEGKFTLKSFCGRRALPYADMGIPIPSETMVAYGLDFQERLVPNLEDRTVIAVNRVSKGFLLQLDNAESLCVSRVIVAVGFNHFEYVPPSLRHLPPELLSHSSRQRDLRRFKGCDVTVIGAGASALDLAALLQETGADVRLVARQSAVVFNPDPAPRSLSERIRAPMSQLGTGWKSRLLCDAPMLFRHLPWKTRVRIVKNTLGPAGGWQMRRRFEGHVPMLLGRTPQFAEVRGGRVYLQLCDEKGVQADLTTSHVIAATGYRVDCRCLPFLGEEIRSGLELEEFVPVLSGDFQSSISGLYFVGLSSANYFGPVMRFVAGAGYTAGRLAKHLTRVAR